jgi:hypothetical protein
MPDNGDEERFTLRYSRERRLANAPLGVKRMYEERASGKKPGFLSFLTGNRGMKITLGTVLAFAAMAMLITFLNRKDDGTLLGSYRVKAEAALSGNEILLSFSLRSPKELPADVLSLRSSLDGLSFVARDFALSGKKDEDIYFRLTDRAGAQAVECLLSVGNSQISLRLPLKRERP